MRNLINDLRHTATPLGLSSREELAAALKAAHVALLRASILDAPLADIEDPVGTPTLRRYALWLEDVALEGKLPEQEAQSALNLAANLYEFVAEPPRVL